MIYRGRTNEGECVIQTGLSSPMIDVLIFLDRGNDRLNSR